MLETWDGESIIGAPQEKDLVTKAPRLNKSDGAIDWSKPAAEIFNQVRALKPWPGTYTNLLRFGKDPMRVIVREVAIQDSVVDAEPGVGQGTETGIVVQCGDGAISISRIQPAGKREMDSDEFVRGYSSILRFGNQ